MAIHIGAEGARAFDRIDRNTNLPSWTACSVLLWVKPEYPATSYGSFIYVASNSGGYYVQVQRGPGDEFTLYTDQGGGGSATLSSTVLPTVDMWTHLALTLDGENAALYKNGEYLGARALQYVTNLTQIALGGTSYDNGGSDTEQLNVLVAHIKLFDAALTEAQIKQEMQSSTLRTGVALNSWTPGFQTVTDYSGFGRDWSVIGDVEYEDGPPIGWGAAPLEVAPRPALRTMFITSGTTFAAPVAWPGVARVVECIGGGGGGGSSIGDDYGLGGGGGGYARAFNVAAVNGCSLAVGTGGAAETAGGDTWFNGENLAASSCGAKGGGAGGEGTGPPGAGGDGASGIGSTKYSGGSGGAYGDGSRAGSGGGAAAGPNGVGKDGGLGGAGGAYNGAGGGGGGGGSSTAGGDSSDADPSGAGGVAQDGTAGGVGVNTGNGNPGSHGSGGSGGAGNGTPAGTGGAGGDGIEWTTKGAGGGGGGGGGGTSTLGAGGAGGLYGGGGGGSGYSGLSGSGGTGGAGLIVVTYESGTGSLEMKDFLDPLGGL